jgi:hypothetical protein
VHGLYLNPVDVLLTTRQPLVKHPNPLLGRAASLLDLARQTPGNQDYSRRTRSQLRPGKVAKNQLGWSLSRVGNEDPSPSGLESSPLKDRDPHRLEIPSCGVGQGNSVSESAWTRLPARPRADRGVKVPVDVVAREVLCGQRVIIDSREQD